MNKSGTTRAPTIAAPEASNIRMTQLFVNFAGGLGIADSIRTLNVPDALCFSRPVAVWLTRGSFTQETVGEHESGGAAATIRSGANAPYTAKRRADSNH